MAALERLIVAYVQYKGLRFDIMIVEFNDDHLGHIILKDEPKSLDETLLRGQKSQRRGDAEPL